MDCAPASGVAGRSSAHRTGGTGQRARCRDPGSQRGADRGRHRAAVRGHGCNSGRPFLRRGSLREARHLLQPAPQVAVVEPLASHLRTQRARGGGHGGAARHFKLFGRPPVLLATLRQRQHMAAIRHSLTACNLTPQSIYNYSVQLRTVQ